MNSRFPNALVGTLVALGLAQCVTTGRAADPVWKRVPIPKQGYPDFGAVVITSKMAYEQFLATGSKPEEGWGDRRRFEKALEDAKLDFDEQALVILRHAECSSSIGVNFRVLQVNDGRVVCELSRAEPPLDEDLEDLEATYCFALAVEKDEVNAVEVRLRSNRLGYLSKNEVQVFPLVLNVGAGRE